MSPRSFEEMWNQPLPRRERGLGAPLGADNSANCPFADEFEQFAADVVSRVQSKPSVEAVNVGKLFLLDKEFERLSYVSAKHRYTLNNPKHRCVRDVLDDAYLLLQTILLELEAPQTVLPKPRKKKKEQESSEPSQKIAATLLGFRDKA